MREINEIKVGDLVFCKYPEGIISYVVTDIDYTSEDIRGVTTKDYSAVFINAKEVDHIITCMGEIFLPKQFLIIRDL